MRLKQFLSTLSHLIAGLSGTVLLVVASWLIASTSLAGVALSSPLLPAIVIRALALLRVSGGYAALWFGHDALLKRLTATRTEAFQSLHDAPRSRTAEQIEQLENDTDLIAAFWIRWIENNVTTLISTSALLLCVSFIVPWGTAIFATVCGASFSAYAYLLRSGFKQAEKLARQQGIARERIYQHIRSASIWHLYERYPAIEIDRLWRLQTNRSLHDERWFTLLQSLCIIALVYYLGSLPVIATQTASAIIIPVLLFSAGDWLLRIINSESVFSDTLMARQRFAESLATASDEKLFRIGNRSFENHLKLDNFRANLSNHDALNVTLPARGVVLVKGESGIGKSQLLQAIAGLVPSRGTRVVDDQRLPSGLVNNWHYLAQTPQNINGSVRDNLNVTNTHTDEAIRHMLTELDLTALDNLDEWLGQGGRSLSGGELKRLALAREFLQNNPLVLLDEPFEGLDQASIERTVALINQQAQGALIITASHFVPASLRETVAIDLGNL